MRISDWSSDVCSSDLLLGTDSVGRDLLSRIIWGARTTYAVVPLSIGSAFLLGISAGMLAGYYGGWLDHLVSRRSEEHTSELQSLMRISYAVFCLKKKNPETKLIVTT